MGISKNKICYVIARQGVSGGTGSLSLRLFSYLHENGFPCAYFCCENNDNNTFSLIQNQVDYIICINDPTYTSHFYHINNLYEDFVFLTYSLDEYLAIDTLRDKYTCISRNIYYVVHALAFSSREDKHHPIFSRTIKSLFYLIKYRQIIKNMINNNSILFMDNYSVQNTSKSLHLKIDDSLIQQLPISLIEYTNDAWDKLDRHTPYTIGTLCRMEFPMKGYVMGLIDVFSSLLNKYDLNLIIVGDGEGAQLLRDKISALSEIVRKKILYKNSIPYSEINIFFSRCDLFLGMGTTLLDASNHNVLALPVFPYLMDLKVSSLFLNNVNHLLADGPIKELSEVLNYLYSLSREEYNELIKSQYNLVRINYSIDEFISILLDSHVGIKKSNHYSRMIYSMAKNLHHYNRL